MMYLFCLAILGSKRFNKDDNDDGKQIYKVTFKEENGSRNVLEKAANYTVEAEDEIEAFISEILKDFESTHQQPNDLNKPSQAVDKSDARIVDDEDRKNPLKYKCNGTSINTQIRAVRTAVSKNNLVSCLVDDAIIFAQRFVDVCFVMNNDNFSKQKSAEDKKVAKTLPREPIMKKAFNLIENFVQNNQDVVTCDEQTIWWDSKDKSAYWGLFKDLQAYLLKEKFQYYFNAGYQFKKDYIKNRDTIVQKHASTNTQLDNPIDKQKPSNKIALIQKAKIYTAESLVVSYEVDADITGLVSVMEAIKNSYIKVRAKRTGLKIFFKSDISNDVFKTFTDLSILTDQDERSKKIMEIRGSQKKQWVNDFSTILNSSLLSEPYNKWMSTGDNTQSTFETIFEYKTRPNNHFSSSNLVNPVENSLEAAIQDFAVDTENFFLVLCETFFSDISASYFKLESIQDYVAKHCNFFIAKSYLREIKDNKILDKMCSVLINRLDTIYETKKPNMQEHASLNAKYCMQLMLLVYKNLNATILCITNLDGHAESRENLATNGKVHNPPKQQKNLEADSGNQTYDTSVKPRKPYRQEKGVHTYESTGPHLSDEQILAEIGESNTSCKKKGKKSKNGKVNFKSEIGGSAKTTSSCTSTKIDVNGPKVFKPSNKVAIPGNKEKKDDKNIPAWKSSTKKISESSTEAIDEAAKVAENNQNTPEDIEDTEGFTLVKKKTAKALMQKPNQATNSRPKRVETVFTTPGTRRTFDKQTTQVKDIKNDYKGESRPQIIDKSTQPSDKVTNKERTEKQDAILQKSASLKLYDNQESEFPPLERNEKQVTGSKETPKKVVGATETTTLLQTNIKITENVTGVEQVFQNTCLESKPSLRDICQQSNLTTPDIAAVIGNSEYSFFAADETKFEDEPAKEDGDYVLAAQPTKDESHKIITENNPNDQELIIELENMPEMKKTPEKQISERGVTTETNIQLQAQSISETRLNELNQPTKECAKQKSGGKPQVSGSKFCRNKAKSTKSSRNAQVLHDSSLRYKITNDNTQTRPQAHRNTTYGTDPRKDPGYLSQYGSHHSSLQHTPKEYSPPTSTVQQFSITPQYHEFAAVNNTIIEQTRDLVPAVYDGTIVYSNGTTQPGRIVGFVDRPNMICYNNVYYVEIQPHQPVPQ